MREAGLSLAAIESFLRLKTRRSCGKRIRICCPSTDILGPVDMHNTSEIHSSKSSGLYMDIENIKQNQLVNVEAIRSLSDSVLHITSVISKFQDYMGKNKTHLHEGPSTGSIKHNENSENGNQVIAQLQDPIEIDGHDSFVSDQLTNPMGNNEAESISQLDDSSEAPSSMTDALPEIWDKMATDMRTLIKYGDQILL